jgi:hypothetical protein
MPNELSISEIVIMSTVIPIVIAVLTIYTCLKYKEKILYEKRVKKLESTRYNRNYRAEVYGVKENPVQITIINYETRTPQSDIEKKRYIKNKKNNTTTTH